jgi:hypothetical protein
MARTTPSKAAYSNMWAQIGISACVLLLPPIAVGTAVYVMFPMRDDGAAPPRSVVADVRPAIGAPPPATPTTGSIAPTTGSIAPSTGAYSLASAHQEPVATQPAVKDSITKDEARVLSPRPVHVTVVVAPPAAGTEGMAPPQPAPSIATPWADMVTAPDPVAVSPVAAVAPDELVDPPRQSGAIQAEAPAEPRASRATARRFRSYVRHLAKRSGSRNVAQSARVDGSPNRGSWLQSIWHARSSARPPRNPQRS